MKSSSPSRSSTSNTSSSATTSTSTSASPPVALPSDEALQLLLSPDGYYTYLSIPKPDPSYITNPYLDAAAAAGGGASSIIDLDQVKKNYRRLSLKHHPDRRGGDEETFRALNRAKVVLSSPKLRREYDLVGLDLEDDAEDHQDHHHHPTSTSDDTNDTSTTSSEAHHEDSKEKNNSSSSSSSNSHNKTETVMSHLASVTLAAVLQMVVRTGLMGIVSVLLSRYTILTILTLGMLSFLSYRIFTALNTAARGANVKLNLWSLKDVGVPLLIAVGVFCMFRGRRFVMVVEDNSDSDNSGNGNGEDNQVVGDSTTTTMKDDTEKQPTGMYSWTWTFWFGETLVMTLFLANSFEKRSPALLALFTTISSLFALWLRGQFWRYATLLGFQGVIALLVVLAFPIMEMILEQIVEEKMKKVGEKIRAHDARLRELQRKKTPLKCPAK